MLRSSIGTVKSAPYFNKISYSTSSSERSSLIFST
ncbi:hypothetical protein BMETH_1298_1 [methanotrophic bacterial endosymbiont of Bathymodiolus sp.]|nr:hypothetical protein BMETH_1298_1 [methanotrophic bacterial endosymbiont of Bathymodiolus sp.]